MGTEYSLTSANLVVIAMVGLKAALLVVRPCTYSLVSHRLIAWVVRCANVTVPQPDLLTSSLVIVI